MGIKDLFNKDKYYEMWKKEVLPKMEKWKKERCNFLVIEEDGNCLLKKYSEKCDFEDCVVMKLLKK